MKEEYEKNNITRIKMHHDCDGAISGLFTSFHVENSKLEFCNTDFGDITGLKKGDWMCDMKPKEDKIDGLNVLDHHGPYPIAHKYNLIYDTVPAGLIAWREFKEDIPKSEWWKVACACTGDGQPERIPAEIFKECPQLLNWRKTSAYKKYEWSIRYFPTYRLISSPINGLLRTGQYDEALRLIIQSKTPKDILTDAKALDAKNTLSNPKTGEITNIMKRCESINFQNLIVIIFYSKYRMSGYVSSVVNSAEDKTTIAINRRDGKLSLRGELADYWEWRLKELDYLEISGHSGFKGGTLRKINAEVFIEDLTKMLQ